MNSEKKTTEMNASRMKNCEIKEHFSVFITRTPFMTRKQMQLNKYLINKMEQITNLNKKNNLFHGEARH